MRRLVIVSFLLLAALLAIARFAAQSRLVRQLDDRYQQVRRGMNIGDVGVLMNRGTFEMLDEHSGEDLSGWWGNTPLGVQDAARIRSALRFTAPKPFTTVRFVFTFDDHDKLVGKHRFN